MISINEILRNNINDYKKEHYVSNHQEKILWNIINCRTELMGRRILKCNDCEYEQVTYCSCRNRHCPICLTFRNF